MEKYWKYYLDHKMVPIFFLASLTCQSVLGQKNCNVYKWEGDLCRYEACNYLKEAPKYFQLRKEFHEIYDKALEICPEYSDAYRAKSVAYLKTGDFVTWKQLMDQAVELNPVEHLGYRGWCRFQFLRDYQGAIDDLELLEKISDQDIGYSQNGMYHLSIAKALCYKMVGGKAKAIRIIEQQLQQQEHVIGLYDMYHLGVLYLEIGNPTKALECFEKQSVEYDCAENAYRSAMAYNENGNHKMTYDYLIKANELYSKAKIMYDPYTHPVDKVFYQDIVEALKIAQR